MRPPSAPPDRAPSLGGPKLDARASVRGVNWPATALGPVDRWPVSLRTAIELVLGCPAPMQVWWGNSLVVAAHNDAFVPFAKSKHPTMLGVEASDAWREIWISVRAGAFSILGGGASQTYALSFPGMKSTTLSLSPIPDDNGLPGGILVTADSPSTAEETSAALVEASNAKDEFLAMLGHELRNPLAPISRNAPPAGHGRGGNGTSPRTRLRRRPPAPRSARGREPLRPLSRGRRERERAPRCRSGSRNTRRPRGCAGSARKDSTAEAPSVAVNGTVAVRSSNSTIPKAYRSARSSTGRFKRPVCSGAR